MIVLQTLGLHIPTQQRGIFQYQRTANGVIFDCSIGQSAAASFQLTHDEWLQILQAIAAAPQSTFRLTPSSAATPTPPNQDLYGLLQTAVPNPATGNWNDTWKACVCSVLQHEGSIEFYHGPLGQGNVVPLVLTRV